MRRLGLRVAFLLSAVLLIAKASSAQVAIAGVVKDSTGAIMPGVTINTQKSFVINRDALDAIPTTRRDTTARALLIPGTTVTPFVLGQYNMTSHGSSTSDFTMAIDGLRVNNLCGSGQYSGFYMN